MQQSVILQARTAALDGRVIPSAYGHSFVFPADCRPTPRSVFVLSSLLRQSLSPLPQTQTRPFGPIKRWVMSLMFSDGSRPLLTEGNRRPGNPAVLAALTAAFLGGWLDLHSVWIERLVAWCC